MPANPFEDFQVTRAKPHVPDSGHHGSSAETLAGFDPAELASLGIAWLFTRRKRVSLEATPHAWPPLSRRGWSCCSGMKPEPLPPVIWRKVFSALAESTITCATPTMALARSMSSGCSLSRRSSSVSKR